MLYSITGKNFSCGIETRNAVVVHAAPIFKWSLGKDIAVVLDWCKSKFLVVQIKCGETWKRI